MDASTPTSSAPAGPAEHTVRLVGGPPDWRDRTLTMRCDPSRPDSLGAYLISRHTPYRGPDEDPAPRAVYEPDPDSDDLLTWHFQGWFPSAATDPDPAAYLAVSSEDDADAS